MTETAAVAARAEAHWRNYLASRDLADLDAAIRLYDWVLPVRADLVPKQVRDALIAAAEPETGRIDDLAAYAAEIITVVLQIDDPVLVDRAIDLLQAVVAAAPEDHPQRGAYLSDLGLVLQLRHRRTDAPGDLDEALRVAREAIEATKATDAALPAMRSNLAVGLVKRFQYKGNSTDLQEAIAVAREATSSSDAADAGVALGTLSDALRLHAHSSGDMSALDDAIEVGRAAYAATPEDDPNRASRSTHVAIALLDRFNRRGRTKDLDDSIMLLRQAAATTPANHPDRRRELANLSNALQTRYARTGERADIDESIEVGLAALGEANRAEAAVMSTNLSSAFLRRAQQFHDPTDIDHAVTLSRDAVTLTPTGHSARPGRAANLGNALRQRFLATNQVEDIDEAVAALEDAAAAADSDERILSNLAAALRIRFERFGTAADLDASIHYCQAALARADQEHPDRAAILSTFGLALRRRYDQSHEAADLHNAVEAWREAANMRQARTMTRLAAALAWASATAAEADWISATYGYATAVRLLPTIASRALSRRAKEALLPQSKGAVADGCACAILNQQVDQAVVLMDMGRGVLWSQLLDTRSDLSALKATAPALADRLASVGAALDSDQLHAWPEQSAR